MPNTPTSSSRERTVEQMRDDILAELFYGNINPGDKQFKRKSEFGKVSDTIGKAEERFRELLDDEGKAVLDKLMSAQMTINGITAKEYFIDGFRIGARIALAIGYNDSENLLPITD